MELTEQRIKELIAEGEGTAVEFKTCRKHLNRDVYETVCAFLNRHGGRILLGVADDGELTGVDPEAAEQIKQDFINAINNPQKINPTCYLSVDEVEVSGRHLIHVYVPESSQVHRCNGRIYDRNGDGDFDITDHTRQVADLYHRKQATYSENKIYPFAGLDELDRELIAKCRKIAVFRQKDHPWENLDDLALLKSAQLYQADPENGKSGVTLAGLLLLGKRSPLLSAVPHHRTDLIVRKVNLDRYDDRDFVDVNLVESYERIMAFVAKHLPDPFFLEGTTSISIRDAIFREVASNICIHREYMNAFPAKLIIQRGQVRTENSNKPHGFGVINPETFTPFPKNPVIAAFFRQIGRADELGSGMRNLMRYGKAYGGSDPEMIENNVFRIIVKVPELAEGRRGKSVIEGASQVGEQVSRQVPDKCPTSARQVLSVFGDFATERSRAELQNASGLVDREHFVNAHLKPLLELGLLEMTIPDKPHSSKQKYRLTIKGREILKNLGNT